jgi:hypothetical protein
VKLAGIAVVATIGVVLTGCATHSPQRPPAQATTKTSTSTSAAPQVMKFGEERPGKRGVLIVGVPAAAELPADPTRAKELTRGLKFEVTVRNTTQQALEAAAFAFSATADGAPATLVTDGKLQADVLPGKEGRTALLAALPAKPSEVTIKIVFEKGNPLYWTGTV